MKVLATILLSLTLAAPLASAGIFSHDPVTVTVAGLHVGDKLRYDEQRLSFESSADGSTNGTRTETFTEVVEVRGTSRAMDRFGIERDVEDFVIGYLVNGTPQEVELCHGLPGSSDAISHEPLLGGSHGGGAHAGSTAILGFPTGETRSESNTTVLLAFGGSCRGQSTLAGKTIHEGDQIDISVLFPGEVPQGMDRTSAPASAADFVGRPALSISWRIPPRPEYSLPGGEVRVMIADGLPGLVETTYLPDGTDPADASTLRLTGIELGTGPALALPNGAKLPVTAPASELADFAPRSFDDRALGLRYPYADALAALVQDPQLGFGAYLDAHPNAVLVQATYTGRTTSAPAPGTRGDGTWMLTFSDGKDAFFAATSRSSIDSPNPLVASQPLPASNSGQAKATPLPFPAAPPTRIASGEAIARLAERAGIARGAGTLVMYSLFGGFSTTPTADLRISNEPVGDASGTTESRSVMIDATNAALETVSTTSTRTTTTGGLVSVPTLGEGVSGGASHASSGLTSFGGPAAGSGLAAVAGAAGIAGVLLLIVKFLVVPLFTRLRRSTLLDNAVRARLYERVRAEPGIHQADLVDFAGLGRQPTVRHLDQLVRHGFLAEMEQDARVTYYASGEVPPEVARREAVLRAGSNRAVYDLYAREPSLSLREAGARLGLSAPSVYRAKARLTKVGLLPAPPEPDAPLVR